MAKRRSLENVLSPLEPEWNEALLKEAGFRRVQMFWRCLNFCGWIAVK
jgi:tRNA (cmo5U34)-methyltransferase